MTQRKLIYETFVLSNFNFCPVVWHYCSKKSTQQMERIQKRALRFLLDDHESTYDELLNKAKISTLTLSRIRQIATEVFKCIRGINPPFMSQIFKLKDSKYNLRNQSISEVPKFKTHTHGKNAFRYQGCHIWNQLPNEITNATSLTNFKCLLKKWNRPTCKCNVCNHF